MGERWGWYHSVQCDLGAGLGDENVAEVEADLTMGILICVVKCVRCASCALWFAVVYVGMKLKRS